MLSLAKLKNAGALRTDALEHLSSGPTPGAELHVLTNFITAGTKTPTNEAWKGQLFRLGSGAQSILARRAWWQGWEAAGSRASSVLLSLFDSIQDPSLQAAAAHSVNGSSYLFLISLAPNRHIQRLPPMWFWSLSRQQSILTTIPPHALPAWTPAFL